MKIGIIGPRASVERVRSLIRLEDAYMECIGYPCSLSEVVALMERVQGELDGIIFTGNRYSNYVCRNMAAVIPWVSLKRSSASLPYALCRAHLAGYDIHRITCDLSGITGDQLLRILTEKLELDADRISLYRYNDTPQYEAYMSSDALAGRYSEGACAYHTENLRSGRASICLTDSASAALVMSRRGFPVYLLTFGEEDIIAALNELRELIKLRSHQNEAAYRQTVLCLSAYMADAYEHGDREFRRIERTAKIESNLFLFAQRIGAAMEKRGETQYLLFTDREELNAATGDLHDMEFVSELLAIPDVERIALGVGSGVNHAAAKRNAQEAHRSATQQPHSCYYVKTDGALMGGPYLIHQRHVAREFQEVKLERISRETNVGITILNALSQAQRQYGFQSVTSSELAEMTGMSLNNIHRVIVKLEAKGYAEVVGRQSYAETGRPRRLIRLNLGFVPLSGGNME